MCISRISLAMCIISAVYYSVNTTLMSSVPSNDAARTTGTSAPDHPFSFHGSRVTSMICTAVPLLSWHARGSSVAVDAGMWECTYLSAEAFINTNHPLGPKEVPAVGFPTYW